VIPKASTQTPQSIPLPSSHLRLIECEKASTAIQGALAVIFAKSVKIYTRKYVKVKVKVKQSRYRPGVAQGVPGS
jgi:hypothetical protein